jgi:AbrB family looped-hinge helix DNA binding protein
LRDLLLEGELLSRKPEAVLRGESRMTSRGQITLPAEIRRKYRLNPGDIICFIEVNGSIVLKLGPLVLEE